MPNLDVVGFPGVRAPQTATWRTVLRQGDYTYLAQGGRINGTVAQDPLNTGDTNVLRAGLIMGKRTSDSLYANSILGTLTVAPAIGATTLTVSVATATEINRRIGASGTFKLTGPPGAAGTVATETVTYASLVVATGVITCTAILNAYIIGSFVQPTDGSELPMTFIPDGYGMNTLDEFGAISNIPFPEMPITGAIVSSQLLNWPSDTSLQQWLMARLNGVAGGQFVFDVY